MLTQSLIIARKEVVDHLRDRRSVASSIMYALMGPAVILLALAARGGGPGPWPAMAAVFALMAIFTGAMGPATDMIAGERERRTLMPLVLGAASRPPVIVGKWLAASAFGVLGLLANVLGFAVVFSLYFGAPSPLAWLLVVPALLAFALLSGAAETLVSAACRSVKEANTWLSMLMFLAMGAAMWLAFRPDMPQSWLNVVPFAGQQRLLEVAFREGTPSWITVTIVALRSSLVAAATMAATAMTVASACVVFGREDTARGG